MYAYRRLCTFKSDARTHRTPRHLVQKLANADPISRQFWDYACLIESLSLRLTAGWINALAPGSVLRRRIIRLRRHLVTQCGANKLIGAASMDSSAVRKSEWRHHFMERSLRVGMHRAIPFQERVSERG